MHSSVALLILLLVASVSANQPSEVSNSQPVPVSGPSQAVGNSPVVQAPAVVGGTSGPSPVEGAGVVSHVVEHQQHPGQPMVGYYSPAGMIQVVGGNNEQQTAVGGGKPTVVGVRNFEQYGQPESASMPPNYKPFGSWGLYIGGNPADGYYTNYYKALSNSVDKQVAAGEQMKPSAAGQSAAFSPVVKQASSSPYVGADYYPFAYSPSELNSGRGVTMESMFHSMPPHSSYVQPQVYSSGVLSPQQEQQSAGVMATVSAYSPEPYGATKRLGQQAQAAAKEPAQQSAGKGYQQQARLAYAYPQSVQASPASPAAVVSGPQHQVVAYPVPVGSQIVGSQPGVDGAFNPYGVHAFTRYAVKPTMVSSEQGYYYSGAPMGQFPAYKQQQQQQVQPQQQSVVQSAPSAAYQPLGYYGYPVSQLHYSQGSIMPSGVNYQSAPVVGGVHQQMGEQSSVVHQHSPNQVEAASEKSETEDKSTNKQHQKRA